MITKDQYQSWKDNDVTKDFLAHAAAKLKEWESMQIYGTTEQIVEQAHERNASIELLEGILTWEPNDLLTDPEGTEND